MCRMLSYLRRDLDLSQETDIKSVDLNKIP